MPLASRCLAGVLAACLLAPLSAARAQLAPSYEPEIGQPGKDVVWVPTPGGVVELMMRLAEVGPGDRVVDLGSGDGRLVIAAAKAGARGFGVDLNADLVRLSNESAAAQGVAERAQFHVRDLFATDISQASVLAMYLLPHLNLRLRPRILAQMKPGARVVSHSFHMGDWQPDDVQTDAGRVAHLWIVPARAMGKWVWRNEGVGYARDYEMDVAQRFQIVTGEVRGSAGAVYLRDMQLAGDRIGFVLSEEAGSSMVRHVYTGRIDGDLITGEVVSSGRPGQKTVWRARRVAGGGYIEPLN